jgi:hypothetical protein
MVDVGSGLEAWKGHTMSRFRGIFLAVVLAGVSQGFAQHQIEPRASGFAYTPSPADWRDINMYQLFTDRFFDGNSGNNLSASVHHGREVVQPVAGANTEPARHYFQGGDWAGVKQKLPYLKSMGVNCIWISGVQMNEQGLDKNFTPYHAYHPSDFYKVEPMFGTFAELKDLIDTATPTGCTCAGRGGEPHGGPAEVHRLQLQLRGLLREQLRRPGLRDNGAVRRAVQQPVLLPQQRQHRRQRLGHLSQVHQGRVPRHRGSEDGGPHGAERAEAGRSRT